MKFKISAKELENLIPVSSILREQKASKEEVEEGGKVSIRVDRGQGFTYDLDVKAKEFTVSGAPDKFKRIVGKRKISATKFPSHDLNAEAAFSFSSPPETSFSAAAKTSSSELTL